MVRRIAIIAFILCNMHMFAADYKLGSDNAFIYSWTADDIAGVYTPKGYRIQHWVETVGDNAHYALFSSRVWGLSPDFDYYVYYPYSSYYYEHECPITALPVSYEGQTQSGNDDTRHLSAYDFMISSGRTTATTADFSMRHLGSVLYIEMRLPQDKAQLNLTAVKLSLSSASVIPVTATMNLPEQKLTTATTARELTLKLEGITIGSDNTLKVFMMIPPFATNGENPLLTVYADNVVVGTTTLLTTEFTEGHCYHVSCTSASQAKGTTDSGKTAASISSSLETPVLYAPDFTPLSISTPTGIEPVTTTPAHPGRRYTLNGKQATATTSGIIIYNGEKHIRK